MSSVPLVQTLMNGAGNGQHFFMRAATRLGIVGVLVAFAIGYIVFGVLLTVASTIMKWVIVNRAQPGVHRQVHCQSAAAKVCQQGSAHARELRT